MDNLFFRDIEVINILYHIIFRNIHPKGSFIVCSSQSLSKNELSLTVTISLWDRALRLTSTPVIKPISFFIFQIGYRILLLFLR